MKNLTNKLTNAALTVGLAGTIYSANDTDALNARHIETLPREYIQSANKPYFGVDELAYLALITLPLWSQLLPSMYRAVMNAAGEE